MEKSISARTFVAFPLSAKTAQLKTYGCIAIVLLAGCSATQVRWDATKMRKDVMVYYNDQIMDNLIRAKNRLPFVHVDITLLTSQGGSQISGTIGAGESRTSTNTSKSMAGALGTIANAVTRPFAYSVTPQQNETLTISTAPALGSQAVAAPEQTQSPKMQITKWTETTEITYPTPSPTPSAGTQFAGTPSPAVKETTTREHQPTQRTIYDLYEDFANCYVKESPTRPSPDECVPGTLKRVGREYYYVPVGTWKCSDCQKPAEKEKDNQKAYYTFCKALFTKGQPGLLGSAVQQGLAAPLAVPSFR